MQTGMTLYINHTLEAVEFYQEAFGLSLGYNEKFPDGTYMHAELQKNGVNVFAVSESKNNALVSAVHEFAKRGVSPTTSIGLKFDTEDEIKRAYDMLITEGVVCRPLGPLPWSVCSADVLDKYGVYWYLYI
ncbi:VOC family protein [Lacrimispora saccharolytica]|nr:VOC family protein [Lacrimispora saccharolytica]MDM8248725.1 VOC family protein [Lacrimispora saccharolytica]